MPGLVSVYDLTRGDVEEIFEDTDKRLELPPRKELEGRIVALAFFEPSTRTYLSFEAAAKRLGADVIGFSSTEGTSVSKGENLADTVRMLENYADVIVMRHKYDGAAKFASRVTKKPIINAGDGKHEHPTQTLIDLYTVRRHFGTPEGLVYGLLGDLKYARVVNSLLRGLRLFRPKMVYLISPELLRVRREILEELNYPYREVTDPFDVIGEVDVLYVTRIQRERFVDDQEYEKVRESYKVDLRLVNQMKKDSIILHALPRVNEIDRRVDKDPRAKYFEQASYGVPIRMSVLVKYGGGR